MGTAKVLQVSTGSVNSVWKKKKKTECCQLAARSVSSSAQLLAGRFPSRRNTSAPLHRQMHRSLFQEQELSGQSKGCVTAPEGPASAQGKAELLQRETNSSVKH